MRGAFGVYIHYPYCRRRCDYCDFAIAVKPVAAIEHGRYADAVIDELHHRAGDFADRELVSIYIGGGTPSLWPGEFIGRVLDSARSLFGSRSLAEVTIEANPIDCTPAALESWLEAGIDRVSIGVQSIEAGELVTLGRDHSMGDGPPAIAAARSAGFRAISADVIIGTPGTSAGMDSVEAIAELCPDHLSVYELTFETGAPLGRAAARGEVAPLPDDELANLYVEAHRRLEARGFEHYEISSYARAGFRAVHNSLYWSGAEYLGVGSSAASLRHHGDGSVVRATNIRSASRYMAAESGNAVAESEHIGAREAALERLWLAMRTIDGASEAAFGVCPEAAPWLLASDLAQEKDGRIRPTLKGFLYADQIATRLMRYA